MMLSFFDKKQNSRWFINQRKLTKCHIQGPQKSFPRFTRFVDCYALLWFCCVQSCQYPSLDNKVHGANMGPTWVLSAPDGPHVGPMNLAIRGVTSLTLWKQPWMIWTTDCINPWELIIHPYKNKTQRYHIYILWGICYTCTYAHPWLDAIRGMYSGFNHTTTLILLKYCDWDDRLKPGASLISITLLKAGARMWMMGLVWIIVVQSMGLLPNT